MLNFCLKKCFSLKSENNMIMKEIVNYRNVSNSFAVSISYKFFSEILPKPSSELGG